MDYFLLFPVFVGIIGILQGGINRWVAQDVGVAQMTLVSNAITTLICILFYLLVKYRPSNFMDIIQLKSSLVSFKWWYIFPPIFGFLIVSGLPVAIAKIGAVKVTVGLIAAQMITSVVWDIYVEHIPLSMLKITGMVLAFASVIVISLSKSTT